ncbi:MAG: DUF4258 domain-containing protein [Caenispirillum sp.]|nr:DUF4258 domain-containing protein [Caenispirillum sp.]
MTDFMQHTAPVTRHAGKRMQQRAIQRADIGLVLAFGDLVKAVGDGTDAVSITRDAAAALVTEGYVQRGTEARRSRVTVLITRDTGAVRTVLWRRGRGGRRYTRGATVH